MMVQEQQDMTDITRKINITAGQKGDNEERMSLAGFFIKLNKQIVQTVCCNRERFSVHQIHTDM